MGNMFKLTIKVRGRRQGRQRRCSAVFIANLKNISRLFRLFLLLTFNKSMFPGN